MDGMQKLLIYIRDAIGYGCVVSVLTTFDSPLRLRVEWIALGQLIAFERIFGEEEITERHIHAAMIDEFIASSREGYEKEINRLAKRMVN